MFHTACGLLCKILHTYVYCLCSFNISSCFMYGGISIPNTLRESSNNTMVCQCFIAVNVHLIEISYVLSVDANAQGRPSRVRLTHEIGPKSTGKINGTLTLMKGQ